MKTPTLPRRRVARPRPARHSHVLIDRATLARLEKGTRRSNAMYWLFIIGPLLFLAAMALLAMVPLFMK